jgi:hypothetical protein
MAGVPATGGDATDYCATSSNGLGKPADFDHKCLFLPENYAVNLKRLWRTLERRGSSLPLNCILRFYAFESIELHFTPAQFYRQVYRQKALLDVDSGR